MNLNQNEKIPTEKDTASRATRLEGAMLNDQPSNLEQISDPFDWVQITIAALEHYLYAGEVTAPMTHRPKMLTNGAGGKSILVRIFHRGEHQTICIGEPLSAEQREEAREFFTSPETYIQKGD